MTATEQPKITYAAAAIHPLCPTATRIPYYVAFWRWDGKRMGGLHFAGGPLDAAYQWINERAVVEINMGRFLLTYPSADQFMITWRGRIETYHGDTDKERLEKDIARLKEAEFLSPKQLSMPADTRRQLRRMEGDRDTEHRIAAWSMAFVALRSVVAEGRDWVVNEHASWVIPSTEHLPDPYDALTGGASSSSSPSPLLSVIPEASSSDILVF